MKLFELEFELVTLSSTSKSVARPMSWSRSFRQSASCRWILSLEAFRSSSTLICHFAKNINYVIWIFFLIFWLTRVSFCSMSSSLVLKLAASSLADLISLSALRVAASSPFFSSSLARNSCFFIFYNFLFKFQNCRHSKLPRFELTNAAAS